MMETMNEMTDTEDTIDIVELTARLGLPDHEQEAVLAWTGRDADWGWTTREVDELIEIWNADTARVAALG